MRIVFKNLYPNLFPKTDDRSSASATVLGDKSLPQLSAEKHDHQHGSQFDLGEIYSLKVIYVKSEEEQLSQYRNLKRAFDIVFSLCVMGLGLPVFLILCLIARFTSKGSIFFSQERVGRNHRTFKMYKFRSMCINAEQNGPQLSTENDPRITKWGRVIRRTRLDELPQFWNVLKGDMSVVGPRPERQHFVTKILEKNPDYRKLQQIKPGITSLGQVHFGYAENVNEMCERLVYDLHYLENVSLRTDIDVILRTIKVMLEQRGK